MSPALFRRFAPFALLALCAAGGFAADAAPGTDIDALVKQFNPDLLGGHVLFHSRLFPDAPGTLPHDHPHEA